MSKNTKQKDSKKKRRISAVKASKESYFKLHWFLLYEDKYRKLSPKAKLLYGLLRSRFELSNTNVQNGVPDADNFIDEENNIFCIFDNVEISFLLDMSVPTVIDAKKELDEAELLEEVQIKDQANRMYVLDPVLDSDMWTFKQQLADIKAKKAEKDKERVRKQKEKRQQKALEKKQEKAKKKALANGVVNVGNENVEEKSCDSKNLNHTKRTILLFFVIQKI
ncbi:replication initiator protein A (plasmid) [Priestia megaterium]